MVQQQAAAAIAQAILDGFDDYREHFRQITNGGRRRFEQAQWQEIQQARKAKVVRATTAPRDAAGQFAAKAEKDARLRKQSPGATPLAPLSVEKVTGTNDVMDIIRALKH